MVVICPSFFGYRDRIIGAFERNGFDVIGFDDRPANDALTKGIIRLAPSLIKTRITNHYESILKQARSFEPKYILFVNPESFRPELFTEFKSIGSRPDLILYAWDSIANKPRILSSLAHFSYASTFDPRDAIRYGLHFRPLFFSTRPPCSPPEYSLAFWGTAHSDRYAVFKKVAKASATASHLPVFSHLYVQNYASFYFRQFLHSHSANVPLKALTTSSLGYDDILALMSRSCAVLDVQHPEQVGLTMRSIETIGTQANLLTTNADVTRYSFYDDRTVAFLNREAPAPPGRLVRRRGDAERANLQDYSIDTWARDLLAPRDMSVFYDVPTN